MSEPGKTPFLQRRDPWGHGTPLWIILAVAFLIPVMVWSLRDLKMHNDVTGWLPRNDPQARLLSWYQTMFPPEDRVLVSWDSCSLTDPRLKQLQFELEGTPTAEGNPEGGSPFINDVTLPSEVLERMVRGGIPFSTALQQVDGLLTGAGPLRIRLSNAGRMRGEYMQSEIQKLLNDDFDIQPNFVTTEFPLPSDEGIAEDDTHAWTVHFELTKYVQELPLYDLAIEWQEMHADPEKLETVRQALLDMVAPASGAQTAGKPCIDDCFVTAGSIAAVSVSLSEAGVADKRAAVEAIRNAVEKIGVPPETVHLGGEPVANVALNQAVADAGWNTNHPLWNLPNRSPILLSIVVSVILSFVMLKSIRLATLVQVASILTIVVALAFLPLSGGSMNMVLIVMPTLLGVLTTSSAIHLSNYWKHSGATQPAESVYQAARTAWLPCGLAAGTTAVGLASLLASNLVPVKDFGLYSAVGCLVSFVVVLYVLPSLMLYWPKSPPPTEEIQTAHWKHFGMWLARHRVLVSGACIAATGVAAWGLWNFETETKVIRYFPTDSRLVQDYVFLEDKLSGVISVDTIVRFDTRAQQDMTFIERARIVSELQDDIRKHPEISGVLSLASFLDLRDADTEDLTRLQRLKLRNRHKTVERRVLERLEENDPEDELISMLSIRKTATDWHESGDNLLNRKDDEVWRVTAQASVLSDLDLEVLIGDMNKIASRHLSMVGSPHTNHVVTGLIPVFLRTQQAVLESLIRSFGMAFAIIAVVMMILLRSPSSGVLTMLPNLMPVIMVFGLLSWMHLKVDIGTMITASVALGIAVDGTLHLITWFQELVKQGKPVEEAVGEALAHCGPAMWQTSAAVGLGMLALLPAELLLVSRFGWIMASLIFAALVADVIFLPALLGGTLGRLIQQAAGSADPDTSEVSVRLKDAGGGLSPTPAPAGTAAATSVRPLKDVS